MPASVMTVLSANKHPNADSLFIYQMGNEEARYQIVANSENHYSIGQNAIVVLGGSKLKPGLNEILYIEEVMIRGVLSQGMVLGSTDLPVGHDLTDAYCEKQYHISWPDIESLFNVRRYLKESNSERVVNYAAKVKLDGTNAGVQVFPDGSILAQSRTMIITPENDNAGFARWVEEHRRYFSGLAQDRPITIFGEWCGKGIQKRCSISKIEHKIFAPFAIQYGSYLEINPEKIELALAPSQDVVKPMIFVLPFFDFIQIDYTNVESMQVSVDIINEWVSKVEKSDPFVKAVFGVDGLGEGLVMYPLPSELKKEDFNANSIRIDRTTYKELVFKCKGEEHKVVKTKQAVQIDPEVAATIDEFVALFVTLPRLEQIAAKIGDFDPKKTGEFLKAFSADVVKESVAELEASNMVWKDVSGAVTTKAKNWWLEQGKKL